MSPFMSLPFNFDELVKSTKAPFPRHSGEPRIVSGAGAGIQLFQRVIKPLDSGFHLSARHRQAGVTTFCEAIQFYSRRIGLK